MIITPMILPQIPNPSSSDCTTLLSYTNSVISGLESVLNRLYEVSFYSDESIVLIRDKVETMLSEAKTMRSKLYSIKAEAVNKLTSYDHSQTMT
jgi:hypothetical protein